MYTAILDFMRDVFYLPLHPTLYSRVIRRQWYRLRTQGDTTIYWHPFYTVIGALVFLVPWLLLVYLFPGTSNIPAHTLPVSADRSMAKLNMLFYAAQTCFMLLPVLLSAALYAKKELWHILGFRRMRWTTLFLWVVRGSLLEACGLFLYAFVLGVLHLPLKTNGDDMLQLTRVAPITGYSILLTVICIAPLAEELYFRSFLFSGGTRFVPVWMAAFLSAFAFGFAHGYIQLILPLTWTGLVYCFLRWKTQSIFPSLLCHMLGNSIAVFSLVIALRH